MKLSVYIANSTFQQSGAFITRGNGRLLWFGAMFKAACLIIFVIVHFLFWILQSYTESYYRATISSNKSKSVYDSLQVWFIHKWKKMIKVCLQVFLSMQVKQHFLSTKDFFFKKILMNKFIFMNIPWNERNRIKITQRECFSSKTSYIWNQSK